MEYPEQPEPFRYLKYILYALDALGATTTVVLVTASTISFVLAFLSYGYVASTGCDDGPDCAAHCEATAYRSTPPSAAGHGQHR